MTLATRLMLWLTAKQVAKDKAGNRYFVSRQTNAEGKKRRSVLYAEGSRADPSMVPPMWHAWLHYTIDDLPTAVEVPSWSKPHLPNQTGTRHAYRPDGFYRPHAAHASHYQPWTPH